MQLFSHQKKDMQELWSFDAKSDVIAGPAHLDSYTLFGTQKGTLVCLSNNGQTKWIYDANETVGRDEALFMDTENMTSITSTPLIFGTYIFFGTELGLLYCLSKEGKLIWKTKLDGAIRAKPTIIDVDGDGRKDIVVGTVKGTIHIVSEKGKVKKSINIKSPIESSVLAIDRKLVVGCNDGNVIAFTAQGKHAWTYATKGPITADIKSSELFNDGESILLVASHDNSLYALSLDGELKWKFETEGSLVSHPITANLSSEQGKDILFGSCDNKLYCVSAHGEQLWSYETDFWVTATPAIVDHKGMVKVILGSYDEKLYVLDGQGDFNLSYMPGLAGIIHQTGYTSMTTSRDIGENVGKKLCDLSVSGHVVSCSQSPNSLQVVVATKQGVIHGFQLQ